MFRRFFRQMLSEPGSGIADRTRRWCIIQTAGRSTRAWRLAGAAKKRVSSHRWAPAGDAYDNALAEAFFATLETELLQRQGFVSRGDARRALFDYIEGWYNPHRRHSALGYLSPAEFEKRWWARKVA